jgi:uncharacterized protein (DUF885 family)
MRRRDLLQAALPALALARGPAAAQSPPPSGGEDGALLTLLDEMFEEDLRRSPEEASELGLDVGPRAALKSRLGDVSQAALEAGRRNLAVRLQRLGALSRPALSPARRTVLDTVIYWEQVNAEVCAFDFVALDGFSPSPYVLSPITGAYQRAPVFLDTKHAVAGAADAEAYLERLNALPDLLDANTARFQEAAARGILPPDFLLDTTLEQIRALDVAPEESGLVRSLDRRAKAKGLGEGPGEKARSLFRDRIRPALQAQIAALESARTKAGHAPGIWRFKDGPEFYLANLKYTTTTSLSPEEIHALGVDQAKEIRSRLETELAAAGLTTGGVAERIKALYARPEQFYPNSLEGRAELLADLQKRLEEVRARLPAMFSKVPAGAVEVRAVPSAIDAGAPLAYSESPPLDGSRPGFVYFNLHDLAEWPKFNLPSTIYHEGLPGHQLQGGIALENQAIPLYVRNLYFSGYGEGWALYAEQLADELGVYDRDPLGRIGWLKAQMFRAGRLIVDTGMHHYRWSRERAVETLVGLDGDAVGSSTREVDRYVAIPGQACSYKIGHTMWNRLRSRAKTALGPRFDIRAFHEAGLEGGAMPLDVLDQVIAAWTLQAAG